MTDTVTETARELLDRKLAEIEHQTFHLAYINQGDRLTPEQVQALLDGKNLYDTDPNFDEWQDEARFNGWESVRDDILTEDEKDLLDEDADLMDELRFAVYDRDKSDLLAELIKHTGSILLRFDLGYEVPWMEFAADEAYGEEVQALVDAAKVDRDANRGELLSMLNQAPYGGNFQILWYGDVEDLLKALDNEQGAATVTFTDPHVVILDTLNGSGMDGQLKGEVSLFFKADEVRVDQLSRHGWTKVAGPVESAYAAGAVFTPATA